MTISAVEIRNAGCHIFEREPAFDRSPFAFEFIMRATILRGIAGITALGLAGTLIGCGSDSSTGPNGGSLTQAEAQLVAANLFSEIARALATAKISTNVAGASQSQAAVPTTVRMTLNNPCTAGGTISGTYVLTSDFNTSGTGSQSGNMSVTSVGCNVQTGTRTIAVSGSFTLTYSASFTNSAPSSNYTWRETGNFTWSGGGCAIDYTAVVTLQGKTSITGSFCGQSVSYSN